LTRVSTVTTDENLEGKRGKKENQAKIDFGNPEKLSANPGTVANHGGT